MLSFALGTLVAFMMFILSSLYAKGTLAILGFADIIVMIFSYIYLIRLKKYVFFSFAIPLTVVEKKQIFHAHLTVDRLSKIKKDRVKLLIMYKNGSESRTQKMWLASDKAKEMNGEILYEIMATKAGRYDFCLRKIRIYDVLGLFYIDIKTNSDNLAIVLPKISTIQVSIGNRVRNFYSDSDSFYKDRSGYDPSETYDIRDYRPGDRLPSVHWKLSAKRDELIVRENSQPMVFAIVIVMNLYGDTADDLLDKIASLSFALIENQCPHYIAWFSNVTHEIERAAVTDEEDFYAAIIEYMGDCAAMPRIDLMAAYREQYRGENWIYDISVSKDEILLNGENMTINEDSCLIFE